jgi:hypothetical protein
MPDPISVDLLVFPGTSASSLFGLYEILSSVGAGWETYVTGEPPASHFKVRIVSPEKDHFVVPAACRLSPT